MNLEGSSHALYFSFDIGGIWELVRQIWMQKELLRAPTLNSKLFSSSSSWIALPLLSSFFHTAFASMKNDIKNVHLTLIINLRTFISVSFKIFMEENVQSSLRASSYVPWSLVRKDYASFFFSGLPSLSSNNLVTSLFIFFHFLLWIIAVYITMGFNPKLKSCQHIHT